MAWESQDDGFIAKILMQEGAKDIPVGTPAMIFVEEEVWNLHTLQAAFHQHCGVACGALCSFGTSPFMVDSLLIRFNKQAVS